MAITYDLMKLAICADVHGNHNRFVKFERQIRGEVKPSDVYVLGDVFLAGVMEEEMRCLDLIKKNGWNFVRGNHDDPVPEAQAFPNHARRGEMLFSHTIPVESFMRIYDGVSARVVFPYLMGQKARVSFIGHTHHPISFAYDTKKEECVDVKGISFDLNPNLMYIINPGTLGFGGRGSFIMFDEDKKRVETLEVDE